MPPPGQHESNNIFFLVCAVEIEKKLLNTNAWARAIVCVCVCQPNLEIKNRNICKTVVFVSHIFVNRKKSYT